jgi:hypothetical protein
MYFGNISATHILNIGTSHRCMVNFMPCLPFFTGEMVYCTGWYYVRCGPEQFVPVGIMLDVVQNSLYQLELCWIWSRTVLDVLTMEKLISSL